VLVLENVWLKYICKLKGFFLPPPPPPQKNPLQIETTFTYVSICMSLALPDGYATLNACCDCGKWLKGAEAAFWDYETRSRIFVKNKSPFAVYLIYILLTFILLMWRIG
jgi:hypothetical protein